MRSFTSKCIINGTYRLFIYKFSDFVKNNVKKLNIQWLLFSSGMVKRFTVTDLRREDVFPNLDYRFSNLRETDTEVVLERDFLGENPLHYYGDIISNELIVANNIVEIKDYVEKQQRNFTWERVRAVSNNTITTIDELAFNSATPQEEERGPTLRESEPRLWQYDSGPPHHRPLAPINYTDIQNVGKIVRRLLSYSLEVRLSDAYGYAYSEYHRIHPSCAGSDAHLESKHINFETGLLLSGGLDSMSVGYLLSQTGLGKVTAFTLKVDEDDLDVVKSRELAKRFRIDLSEVKIDHDDSGVSITLQRYNHHRDLLYTKKIAEGISLDDAVFETLKISGNPKKDNVFCAVAMYLIAPAIIAEGIKTIFCGEGPNEMINDYGYNPHDSGYATDDKGDISFREALTFGLKRTDRQLGRGGLAKHATARMGKIFAHYGLRLESPYFNQDIARVMTRLPHSTSYDTIKQHLVGAMFEEEGLDRFIQGTSKEKFQDGSGISRLLRAYNQQRLIDMFERIYGIKKTGYLKSGK